MTLSFHIFHHGFVFVYMCVVLCGVEFFPFFWPLCGRDKDEWNATGKKAVVYLGNSCQLLESVHLFTRVSL